MTDDDDILEGMDDDLIDSLPPRLRNQVLGHLAGDEQPEPQPRPRLTKRWLIWWSILMLLSVVWAGALGIASLPLMLVPPLGVAVFILAGLPLAACVVFFHKKRQELDSQAEESWQRQQGRQ